MRERSKGQMSPRDWKWDRGKTGGRWPVGGGWARDTKAEREKALKVSTESGSSQQEDDDKAPEMDDR